MAIRSCHTRTGWIRIDHDVLASLGDHRARHGLVSWEETVTRLLSADALPTGAEEGRP